VRIAVTGTTRSGGRRERGAALVEFGIVFPLLFLLVSGIIDFGLAFSDLNSTRQGVREGARQAVVRHRRRHRLHDRRRLPTRPDPQDDLPHEGAHRLSASDTRVKIVFTGLNQVGDSMMVCAQRPLERNRRVRSVMGGRASPRRS
jgi:hypothetical protein